MHKELIYFLYKTGSSPVTIRSYVNVSSNRASLGKLDMVFCCCCWFFLFCFCLEISLKMILIWSTDQNWGRSWSLICAFHCFHSNNGTRYSVSSQERGSLCVSGHPFGRVKQHVFEQCNWYWDYNGFLFLGNVVICNKLIVFHCRAVRKNIYIYIYLF